MGSEVYKRVTGLSIAGAEDYTCSALRVNAPWYKAVIPPWFCTCSFSGFSSNAADAVALLFQSSSRSLATSSCWV